MLEATEAACSAVRAEGKTPTAKCGLRTKRMAAWRAMGRTLLDIGMLVFNVGRCDFRNKHTVSYALMVQSSCHVGVADYATLAKKTCDNMFLSIGVLIELIGIIRMTDQILQPTPLQPLKQLASGSGASTNAFESQVLARLSQVGHVFARNPPWRDLPRDLATVFRFRCARREPASGGADIETRRHSGAATHAIRSDVGCFATVAQVDPVRACSLHGAFFGSGATH